MFEHTKVFYSSSFLIFILNTLRYIHSMTSHIEYIFLDFWAGKATPRDLSGNPLGRTTAPQVLVSSHLICKYSPKYVPECLKGETTYYMDVLTPLLHQQRGSLDVQKLLLQKSPGKLRKIYITHSFCHTSQTFPIQMQVVLFIHLFIHVSYKH